MYEVGDKVQIKSWKELEKDYETTFYDLVNTLAVNLPDRIDFSKDQYDKICKKCKNRIDEIEKVDIGKEWYYLKKSKTIVTGHVIKSVIRNAKDEIDDRFEILDL